MLVFATATQHSAFSYLGGFESMQQLDSYIYYIGSQYILQNQSVLSTHASTAVICKPENEECNAICNM
jgi:hypothetical protein